ETVIAGTGPLLWLLAAQLVRAGARIAAILDTTERRGYLNAAPHAAGFLLSPLFRKGLALRREVARAVRVVTGVTDIRAAGFGKLASVTFFAGGRQETLSADTLLLHQGVVPNVNLAMAAGCAHRWDARQLCFVPELDADGQSSVPGIYIAGDGAGVAGAWAAEERGRLAAIAAVRGLVPSASVPDAQAIRQRLARHEASRGFLDTLFAPPRRFRVPQSDDTIVCRCEEVTAGAVREAARVGCEGPNQLKAFTRCGMGPCQGRLCGLTVTELIAEARGLSPATVGSYRLRPPVKPISLGELARMPASEAAVKAVVR
ncbi:MAG: NAD(P)/FAD-dependent oxidoreductase, partial [Burkholderiaceae bacterium]